MKPRVFAAIVLVASACSPRASAPAADAGVSETALVEEGKQLLAAEAAGHDALVAESERVGARAAEEQGTAGGAILAGLAGSLRVRAFRLTGGSSDDDRKKALDWLATATARADLAECGSAILRAELVGELAHDPRVAYRDLYVARRKLAAASCVGEIDAALDRAAPWRPDAAVLEQIDHALAGAGVAGALEADAGGVAAAAHARVMRVSRWSTTDSARVVIELDRPVAYVLEPASAGEVKVRLEGVDLAASTSTQDADAGAAPIPIEASKGLLSGGVVAQAASNAGSDVAAIASLSLTRPAYRRVFFLPDPFRVVVDLTTRPPEEGLAAGPRPLHRIVIDAGHGGSDPGALGPTGLREKDVTLSIVKAAAPVIARELGVEVRLTRAGDSFVSLEERAEAANAFDADVFLSIHCNSSDTPKPRGVQSYILDSARDDLAARVAQRENGGGSSSPGELRAILDDLRLAEMGARSSSLASLLQRATMASLATPGADGASYADVIDGGVHGAGFFVLVGARMPAVLMEVSFISNPTEEGYLAREDYRARIVDAIVNGLRAYKDGK